MGQTQVHRILNQVGALAFPGVFDTLSAKIASRSGFPMAFVSGYSVAATAIGEPDMGLLTQTEITDRARRICMSVSIPDHRRCRHRLRQSAERPSHRPRIDRRRGRRLLPGRPALAEEVRAHAGQAGHRARGIHSRRSVPPSKPARTAISSSSPAPTPWPSPAWTRRSSASWRPARPVPTPASSRPRPRVERPASHRPPRADADGGQHDRGRQNAGPAAAANWPPWASS